MNSFVGVEEASEWTSRMRINSQFQDIDWRGNGFFTVHLEVVKYIDFV